MSPTSSGDNNRILAMGDDHAGGGAEQGIFSVALSSDGRFVAAGSLDGAVRVWDISLPLANSSQLKPLQILRGHGDGVYSVAFTPDGMGLVSGSLDRTLKHWDLRPLLQRKPGGAVCTMDFAGHKDYVLSVAVAADGRWVVSGSKDRGVQFWDARTATAQFLLQGHKNSVISIDLERSGTYFASGSGDHQARICEYQGHILMLSPIRSCPVSGNLVSV
jgi:general transcriptional corepressor TUP1